MKSYKVIRDFGNALRKGDVFKYEENSGLFVMESTDEERYSVINDTVVKNLVNDGYLLGLNDRLDRYENKCKHISYLVSTLIKQYENDHNDMLKAYNNQEIPTCVKVEADTVYFNMLKVLKKIDSIINE